MRGMNYSEAAAKDVLESVLAGKMIFQPAQHNSQCDFDLVFPDESHAAVEVTRIVKQSDMLISDWVHGPKRGGSRITAKQCKSSWWICLCRSPNVKSIRKNADTFLSRLETMRISRFDCLRDFQNPEIVKVCKELGVTGGGVLSESGTCKIQLIGPIRGGAVGPECAARSAEEKAAKDDNRKKLRLSNKYERHLVCYADAASGLPWIALTEFEPPQRLPMLPAEVTNIWIIGPSKNENQITVWSASRTQQWQRLPDVLIKRECDGN